MSDFVHLHVHTEYSLLDGAARIKDLIQTAVAKGMKALAITDHGSMFGVIDFYKAALKAGIKPILGCEIYVAPNRMEDKFAGRDDANYHLVLLAENETGYRNLLKIVSEAYIRGFYYKPRTDKEFLKAHSEGLIALSACLGGEIPSAIRQGQYDKAMDLAKEYNQIFGQNNFYLELQEHGLEHQREVNRELIKISRNLGIPIVATNDIHYVKKEHAEVQDVLLCVGTGKTVNDEERMDFGSQEFYLKDDREMSMLFGEYQEALSNTVKIAERCNVSFNFGENFLPDYKIPEGYTVDSYLREVCLERLPKRYPLADSNVMKRLEYELDVIRDMGFSGYFLIVWDFVRFAKENGVLVGPGRGSAAGSVVAYVLGITNIDPLKYDLLFERFLNPERVSMPDIDIDFCYETREKVIQYVIDHYGADKVAQIITFGTMAAKAAVRDIGRALDMPYAEVDKVAKLIPSELGMTLDKALEVSAELKQLYELDPGVKKLLDMARNIEGMPRHASTHAAGVVIGKESLTNYLPLYKSNDGSITTQFAKETVEEIGLLKMDLLGLRTLTVIGDTVKLIQQTTGQQLDIENIPLNDAKTFELLSKGETIGVFQLESSGLRAIIRELKPAVFEDIIALVAIYRPGPLGSGMVDDFIRRKHGQSPITYMHPALESILKETYGVILYQEQVMRISSELAGFTMGQADLLRRAMGKKKPEVIAGLRSQFIEGAEGKGVNSDIAGQVFDLMEFFAGYGFNKSHSAAYALVSYQTAYLKANYPTQYLAALLTSIMDSMDKVAQYIDECDRLGIQILPPDVNHSFVKFSVEGESIRFGLGAVKNVGKGAIDSILEIRREKGSFKSFQDFCDQIDHRQVSKRVLEGLIKCGALDSFGHRAQLLHVMDRCVEEGLKRQKDKASGQISLFDLSISAEEKVHSTPLPQVAPFSQKELLSMEKETTGLYISGHPLKECEALLRQRISNYTTTLAEQKDGSPVIIGGIITTMRKITTRKGDMMAFVTVEDLQGSVEVVVFPNVYRRSASLLIQDQIVLVKGKINSRDEDIKILADQIADLEEGLPLESEKPVTCLYVKIPASDTKRLLPEIQGILKKHRGQTPVVLYDEATQKKVKTKPEWWIHLDDAVVNEICALLGQECVFIKG